MRSVDRRVWHVYDESSIAEFVGGFDFVTDIVRTDRQLEGPDGFAFRMLETWSDGEEEAFWLAVSRDEAGVLAIAEYAEASRR